jgi:deoxyguanosine kinase
VEITLDTLGIDPDQAGLPRYIAVEGPIGVGKTTFAKRLATTLGYGELLEQAEENPFLERFYENRQANALPTQLYFLFQRTRQQKEWSQAELFQPARVADYLLEKDSLFASVTLDEEERRLYQMVYDQLTTDVPQPDLVIYLQASTEVLVERVRHRGTAGEQHISSDYLAKLNQAYADFFHYYNRAPLLIVNASEINLASNDEHYSDLVKYLLQVRRGSHYYNPHVERSI